MAANQRSFSFSSASFTYDAYLSFQGEDTRKCFASILGKALNDRGIHTNVHDQELSKWESIMPTLHKIIEGSRIAIIVFSKNYAMCSSSMEILAFIVDNFQQSHHSHRFIFPVFYGIEPFEVRQQSGPYGMLFSRYDSHYRNKEKVIKWRNTLSQVAKLSGWNINGYPSSLTMLQYLLFILILMHEKES
jgi:hypothetical protein